MKGFLGTGATFSADVNLLVQLTMGLALIFGASLARRKRFREHGACQAAVMVLNLVMIALVMSPSFRQIRPQLPGGLRESYYAVASAHAALGTLAELLGLYIVLVAGTNLIPRRLRFQRWKPWMRTELVLWWIVVLFGVGTYYVWYMAPAGKAAPRPVETTSGHAIVTLSNFAFTPKEITVRAGAVVAWVDYTGRHSVVADDGSFQSETLLSGAHFAHSFTRPGLFPYHCGFHGAAGGKVMSGVVRVVP